MPAVPPRMAPQPIPAPVIPRMPAPVPPRMALPTPPRMPAPVPPRMAPKPIPQPIVRPGPAPKFGPEIGIPAPQLPYGGPITMPGQPGLPPGGPQLIGGGFDKPIYGGPPGMPTPGMPGGKSMPFPSPEPMPYDPMPSPGVLPPGYDDIYDGPQMIGGAYDAPIYGGQPSPMPPSMYSQPQPNFANALGTSSPFLNSVQR